MRFLTSFIFVLLFLCFFCLTLQAQERYLSIEQQLKDFTIFKGGLREGHAGLYYYIDTTTFEQKCDSIENTFRESETLDHFYLKLRYLVACLHHGHTRIHLPASGGINYRMGELDSNRLYLPFELLIINHQLLIKDDCSKEQLFPKYTVVKSINSISSADLINQMMPYMAADGINQTFKQYSLYNYFYFHYLLNLFYPDKKGVKIEIATNKTHYYIALQKPRTIDSIYFAKNHENISEYSRQLAYVSNFAQATAYLKVGSFYKGLIEQFGQQYPLFIDSVFSDLQSTKAKNLILDLRNNEGGGDGYENILLAHLIKPPAEEKTVITVPGRQYPYNRYAINLSEDVRNFINDPAEFLRDDSTLLLKDKYVTMMTEGETGSTVNQFTGRIIVLINGGSFSATNAVIGDLYFNRLRTGRPIVFTGEENGGDIYSRTSCAGQSYLIRLPHSGIEIDMPFLCFGELNKHYPKKRLPDYEVYDSVNSLKEKRDPVLDFARKWCMQANTTDKNASTK